MENKVSNKSRIPTTLEEENEPIPKMLTTWEKVLHSEKEEVEATKCSFEAEGHKNCCKTIKDFSITREIYSASIRVFEVIDTGTKQRFAVKIYDKREGEKYQNNEIIILTILRDIEGDFVRCEHLFSTMTHNIIVLELFVSNFFKYMKHRKKMLSLEMASVLVKKLVRIIHILHENGIIYADLKQENIMIDKSGNLKLIDFDQSCRLGEMTDFVSHGTWEYMAPEQAKKETRKELDWYAVGSLLWETLSSNTPNETYVYENDIYKRRNISYIAEKISEMKEDIKLEAKTDDQKAALPFVNDCIRVKFKDRVDLDNAGADFEKVEFLKAVTSEAEERFKKEMFEYVQHVLETRNAFLLLY